MCEPEYDSYGLGRHPGLYQLGMRNFRERANLQDPGADRDWSADDMREPEYGAHGLGGDPGLDQLQLREYRERTKLQDSGAYR